MVRVPALGIATVNVQPCVVTPRALPTVAALFPPLRSCHCDPHFPHSLRTAPIVSSCGEVNDSVWSCQ